MFFSAVSIIHISCVVPSVLRIIPLWAPGLFLELLTGRGLGGREKVGGGKKKKSLTTQNLKYLQLITNYCTACPTQTGPDEP